MIMKCRYFLFVLLFIAVFYNNKFISTASASTPPTCGSSGIPGFRLVHSPQKVFAELKVDFLSNTTKSKHGFSLQAGIQHKAEDLEGGLLRILCVDDKQFGKHFVLQKCKLHRKGYAKKGSEEEVETRETFYTLNNPRHKADRREKCVNILSFYSADNVHYILASKEGIAARLEQLNQITAIHKNKVPKFDELDPWNNVPPWAPDKYTSFFNGILIEHKRYFEYIKKVKGGIEDLVSKDMLEKTEKKINKNLRNLPEESLGCAFRKKIYDDLKKANPSLKIPESECPWSE